MAEINLLATNTPKQGLGTTLVSVMVKALAVVWLLVLIYFGYLFFAIHTTNNAIAATTQKIEQDQQDIINNKDRKELITRQGQLKEANGLIQSHVYWSRFFRDMAQATLRTATYGGFVVESNGSITVSLMVPDYQTLDQFLQVFDLPQFNKNFSDVKIVSIAKGQLDNATQLNVRINFRYNISALKGTTLSSTP